MWRDEDIVRLCLPVAECKQPLPGSVVVTCENCGEDVWFDARQQVTPGERVGCVPCIFRAMGLLQ